MIKEMEVNKIYNVDCVEFLKTMPDKSVDLIITDPPYGVSFKKKGEPYMIGDHINPMPYIYSEFHRVLKDDGVIFCFTSMSYLTEMIFPFQTYFKLHNIIIWDKVNPAYPRSKGHFCLQYEPILYGSKGLHHLKSKKCGDIIQAKIPRGKIRKHPTQKPEEVIDKILKSCLDEKKIVFDPFCGSGTFLVSAIKAGKDYIGCEINKDYVKIAEARIKSISNPLF